MSEPKQIAVIVAGIDEEYQNSVIDGISAAAKKMNANVACFAAFGGVIASGKYDIGEYNIYQLVNYDLFDGVILMTNTVCDINEKKKIINRVKEAGIPAITLDGDDDPDFYNIEIDNTKAMRDIVQHVIKEHGAQIINYISGPLSNPEAQDRYEAYLHVMAENKLIVDARRVYFGEFRAVDGERAVEDLFQSRLPLPDAIICANDAMALGAIRMLEKHGRRVPEDILVTGFDNTYNARHHYPALTSVARPLFKVGYKACEMIIRAAGGETCEKTAHFRAAPVFSESCGCRNAVKEDLKRYKISTFKVINSCRSDISMLNRITSELAETETVEESLNVIGKFLHELDCEQCCLCLCSEWKGSITGRSTDYQIHGYTKTMSAPLIWTKDGIGTVDSFPSAQMFPVPIEGTGNISYFLPLHFRERCLGYYVITNSQFPTKSMLCIR